MATTLGPKGRMTKALITPHNVGYRVVSLVDEHQTDGCIHVGEIGTIRRVIISCPNDGDETFLMFYVRAPRGTVFLHSLDFAPAETLGGVR
jgi:hypothetical protein